MLITDSITFNVRERGRKHRGQDRNWDIPSLQRLINSPETQERVKHGDMQGYYGHWPRMVFGMATTEGGVDKRTGKAVALPMAVRTVELHCDSAGVITHRAEFMDTEAGRIAEGLYKSKGGGFSSAIEAVPGTNPHVARAFHGFDFVIEPNYTTNRGHQVVLDAVGGEMPELLGMMLDQALAGENTLLEIFDSLQQQHLTALAAFERTSNERDELLDRLARVTSKSKADILDSVMLETAVLPSRHTPADLSEYTQFAGADLQKLDEPPQPQAPATAETRYAEQRFGVNLR